MHTTRKKPLNASVIFRAIERFEAYVKTAFRRIILWRVLQFMNKCTANTKNLAYQCIFYIWTTPSDKTVVNIYVGRQKNNEFAIRIILNTWIDTPCWIITRFSKIWAQYNRNQTTSVNLEYNGYVYEKYSGSAKQYLSD